LGSLTGDRKKAAMRETLFNILQGNISTESGMESLKFKLSIIRDLVEYAEKIGCHDVGFTELPPDLIFKNKAVLYSHG